MFLIPNRTKFNLMFKCSWTRITGDNWWNTFQRNSLITNQRSNYLKSSKNRSKLSEKKSLSSSNLTIWVSKLPKIWKSSQIFYPMFRSSWTRLKKKSWRNGQMIKFFWWWRSAMFTDLTGRNLENHVFHFSWGFKTNIDNTHRTL